MTSLTYKNKVREKIWRLLEERKVATFPLPPYGRIPNFIGAEKAALNLTKMDVWRNAKVIKVNPDSPQMWVRKLALESGKRIVMPTPRLKDGFLFLDPNKIQKRNYRSASTIKGAYIAGVRTEPNNLPEIDLVVIGSVAVTLIGDRLGKSKGFAEIEWAILKEEGRVDEDTPVATTVHDLQVVEENFEVMPYDLPVDYIITPSEVIKAKRIREKPKGILWPFIPTDKIKEIPLLQERWRRRYFDR
ncbi:MAG: 5-formyltetrahydrofolate cyclo-ligase [Nitrososphaeria archaeon]